MKHRFRFWGKLQSAESMLWEIETSELPQISKVLRYQIGDVLEVQDQNGRWSKGCIVELSSKTCLVQAEHISLQAPHLRKIRICAGILKPSDLEEMLPSLVELGVAEIHLFLSEGIAKHRLSEKHMLRWQKIILTACKQCKRASIPLLRAYPSLAELTKETFIKTDELLVLEPNADASISEILAKKGDRVTSIVIGSESGLSESEFALLKSHGFQGVRCGPYVLRGLTAAILAASLSISTP